MFNSKQTKYANLSVNINVFIISLNTPSSSGPNVQGKNIISITKINFYNKNIIPSTKNIYPSITVLCLSPCEDVTFNNYLLNAK